MSPIDSYVRTPDIPSYVSVCKTRRLILVDVENLAGGANVTVDQIRTIREELAAILDFTEWDQVVIGCSHFAFLNVAVGWPNVRYLLRSGRDGADTALLDELAATDPAAFGMLVIASGDHIFTRAVAASTIPTQVVSRDNALATKLRLATQSARLLPSHAPVAA